MHVKHFSVTNAMQILLMFLLTKCETEISKLIVYNKYEKCVKLAKSQLSRKLQRTKEQHNYSLSVNTKIMKLSAQRNVKQNLNPHDCTKQLT